MLPAIRKIGRDDQIYREICQFCDMCLAVIWHAVTFYGLKLSKEDIWLRMCWDIAQNILFRFFYFLFFLHKERNERENSFDGKNCGRGVGSHYLICVSFFSGNNNFISCSHCLILVDKFATSKVTIFGSFGVNSDKVSKEWRKTGYTIWSVGIR